ncbi:hypothetical protein D3C85_1442830 [compost metagenome]
MQYRRHRESGTKTRFLVRIPQTHPEYGIDQIRQLQQFGYFGNPVPNPADIYNSKAQRLRSYSGILRSQCGIHCSNDEALGHILIGILTRAVSLGRIFQAVQVCTPHQEDWAFPNISLIPCELGQDSFSLRIHYGNDAEGLHITGA